MSRYYFDVDGQPDLEGSELATLSAAKCEAVKLAGRIICDQADSFWDKAEWTLTVSDDKRLSLFQLHIVGTEAPVLNGLAPSPKLSA